MNTEQQQEWEQIQLAQKNPEGFNVLYVRYYEPILQFIYKRVSEKDEAYELAANTFMKAIQNIRNYRDRGFKFSSWLFKIALNEVNEYYRKSKKYRVISIDESSCRFFKSEGVAETNDQLHALKKALQLLDETDIQLLELRFFEERSFAEVAEILGITEGNAKIRTYRVIEKLKKIFHKL